MTPIGLNKRYRLIASVVHQNIPRANELDVNLEPGILGDMTTLVEARTDTNSATWIRVGWISMFALLTGLGAQVAIPLPFTPVPITLQTLVVVASGVILGRDGWISQVVYLLLGGIGLPLFAGGVGHTQYLFGASGGYLIGFVSAAAIAGRWIHPQWSSMGYWTRSLRLFAVSSVVFVPGVLQLALVGNFSVGNALLLGFLPFIPGDILKTLIAAGIPQKFVRR